MSICAVILAILSSVAPGCPHVHANGNAALASVIEEGSPAAATFPRLVVGPDRILRVLLELRREVIEWLASLGHELQRALELWSAQYSRAAH